MNSFFSNEALFSPVRGLIPKGIGYAKNFLNGKLKLLKLSFPQRGITKETASMLQTGHVINSFNTFLSFVAQAFAANCICEILYRSTRWI